MLHMKNIKLSSFIFLIIFASCKVQQNPAHVFVLPPAPDIVEVYACKFEKSTFEGILPCYGNDCSDNGSPLTTLQFDIKQKIVKSLETESGKKDTIVGQWQMQDDCIITMQFKNNDVQYFRYYPDLQQIELLNQEKKSFPGALNKHHFLSKIK